MRPAIVLALAAGSFSVIGFFGVSGRAQQGAAVVAPSPRSALTGIVRNGTAPMEGVAVSARADGHTWTTTVFTDARGEYVFPAVEAGRYRVRAQAVGFGAGRAEASI